MGGGETNLRQAFRAKARAWFADHDPAFLGRDPGKVTTTYGGAQEIQNNIGSKRILGPPDSTGSALPAFGNTGVLTRERNDHA